MNSFLKLALQGQKRLDNLNLVHLGEGKLLFQTISFLWKYPPVQKTSGDNLEEKLWSGVPKGGLMPNSGLAPAAPQRGIKTLTAK